MNGPFSLGLALAVLVPVMIGPLPAQAGTITARLCGGGTITIPMGDDSPSLDSGCHPKGCHAGTCRGKAKPGKLILRKDDV
jgi:hypothetical protein